MKITKYENQEDWLEGRKGKITGSGLGDIVVYKGTGEKVGFYQLIADRIAEDADDENPMQRGTRLEDEAKARFAEETGKELDTSLVIWCREDNPSIAISPDASVVGEPSAVESKCLSSALHIKAYLTKKIPSDYEEQIDQYFIVNDELQTLYMVFYDPRMPKHLQMFYLTINREDRADTIKFLYDTQIEKLKAVEDIVAQLTF